MGNLTAYQGYPKIWRPDWYDLEEIEAIPDEARQQKLRGLHAAMLAGKAPSAFRAYDTMTEGMDDFVKRLFADFPEVVEAAETGKASEMVKALSRKYSADYGSDHVPVFASLQKGFGERQVFAALPKADPKRVVVSYSLSPSRVSWPSVLEKVRDVPIIQIHSSMFTVAVWKHLLNVAMGTNLVLSPDFDGATDEATRAFQKEQKLTADGVVGPLTWAKMLEVDIVAKS